MFLSESLQKKWAPVLEHGSLPAIKDNYKKAVTAVILENQEKALREEKQALFEAVPVNNIAGSGSTEIDRYDPILISLVRRSLPNLMAYDVAGVQPMTGPTGLIFAMKSRYSTQDGAEALFNEADTDFSGTGTHEGTNPVDGTYTYGTGLTTAAAEALGTGGMAGDFNEMAFSIEKTTVTAKSRALKAEYTVELAQDLKAIHGLDAESELSNILSQEILAEMNREVIRTIYKVAKPGAASTATAGTFDLDVDSNGRWSVERFKGLMFQIERDANVIAQETRRGGTLNGRFKVFIDPYSANTNSASQFVVVGYKGSNAYDAGIFYCPYVPLQMVRAIDPSSFQPKIGFKTRYGMIANPFVTQANGTTDGDTFTANRNHYYRRLKVTNLL